MKKNSGTTKEGKMEKSEKKWVPEKFEKKRLKVLKRRRMKVMRSKKTGTKKMSSQNEKKS